MKKSYKLENLDCANCAAKIEGGIAHIQGVKSVKVNFMMSKLVLEADPEDLDRIITESRKIAHKYEPDLRIIV